MLYEVTKERGAWPHFPVVDVAVQGLRQSEDELRHAAKSPPKVFISNQASSEKLEATLRKSEIWHKLRADYRCDK